MFNIRENIFPYNFSFDQAWTCAPRFQRPKVKEWGNGETKLYQMMLGHCFVYDLSPNGGGDFPPRPSARTVPLEGEAVFFGREGQGENEYAYGTTYAQVCQCSKPIIRVKFRLID